MEGLHHPSYPKDDMKKTPAITKKPAREPRVECHPTVYSERALQMMEQATGQKYARAVATIRPAPVPARDAE
jgi:hypothetical protein